MPTNKDEHLDCVLKSIRLRNERIWLDKHIAKKDEIKESLVEKYGKDIYDPFNSGSYAKNTAINVRFDFDLIAPYKRNAFRTLEEMYYSVYEFLYEKYKNQAELRKQKVSIGLIFHPDNSGHVVKIDIVPGRELNTNQYADDNKLNLYVNDQFGKIEKGSERLLSNVRAQIENIRSNADKEDIRRVIRLLKDWKVRNNKVPKSFFIELITIKAFDNKSFEGGLWNSLKTVIEFIRDNVQIVILPDPGSDSNNVADSLSDHDKQVFSDDMKYILERIEDNSDNIKLYFPINEKFPCDEQTSGRGYGIRENKPSIPPPVRFGRI